MAVTSLHVDVSDFVSLEEAMRRAGPKARVAIRHAVNRTGDMADTQVVRMLTAQTGLKRKTIRKAVKRRRAGAGGLVYRLQSAGGDVGLGHFAARETAKGVTAAPWGKRRLFPHTFTKGGRFPNRKALNFGGQVFIAVGRRLPIFKIKSGLFIPKEMISGATAQAFLRTVRAVLPVRLTHEFARVIR